MKHTIRFIILFFALVMAGTGNAWAISESDIIFNIQPNSSAGTVTDVTVSGMTVTFTANPATGYNIDANHIIAEKMVDALAPRRAPGIASELEVTGSGNSFSFIIPEGYTGAYVTVNFYQDAPEGFTQITDLSQITVINGKYQLTADVSGVSSSLLEEGEFTGTLDGGLHKIIGSSKPLFASTNGAIIRNIIFEDVNISSGDDDGDAGAVTAKAKGATRIYNCGINPSSAERDNEGDITGFYGSSVSGSRYVGSLVGFLDGSARVINCYSYANISGGTHNGGIVGYNNVATTSANLKTMVMNCMFYGNITGGSIAPIYNGTKITNVGQNTGVSNFNYFWTGASYVKNKQINVYNCALSAETRFLQRFEFFRHLLNSNRELAAWWVKGTDGQKSDMSKWVLEPQQIGSNIPFPILKTPGYYPSVVNIDAANAETIDENNEHRNEGRKLTGMGSNGQLAVTINLGSDGALKPGQSATINLNITDKDTLHYNFNYGKVQLPYYNDYCTGNYTSNKVVTGWKITSISGGKSGSFSTGDDVSFDENGNLSATPYNFADRNCTAKDIYSNDNKRVFNQGAYWDVPEGVYAITIEPYWGKAVYLADAYSDVVYNDVMTSPYSVTTVGGGQRFENGKKYNLKTRTRDDTNGQVVYTTMSNAVTALSPSGTVYDNAVVLVGNYHQYNGINGQDKPYTVTSIDLDEDNEPDYSFILRFNSRVAFHPVRYDFLNLIGLGMAQKSSHASATGSYNLGIMQPKYWFEVTNTALFRVTQFEYSPSGRAKKPIILQGGVIEQWVTQQQDAGDAVEYFHVGGNVWFKEFHRGSHQDNIGKKTPHPPVSVTGGDFDKFYLTGMYQSQAAIYDDNAECYISGGRFGEVAGAGMEGIGTSNGKGNVTWVIDHADIKEFYGGGINAAKPIHGNIHTVIKNSHVTQFCGGPKFGNMEANRTVKTIANNCTFGTFFGAGYGGNSYNRYAPANRNNVINLPGKGKLPNNSTIRDFNSWNDWVSDEYTQDYNSTYKGVSTQIDYQFLPMSGNADNVARLFVDFVSFSLATTHNVTSSLTGCKVLGNFYGGGSLGQVDGDATSTLTNCTVNGSAFGAGFSATIPNVEVMPMQFITEPYYDENSGSFTPGVVASKKTAPPTVTYTWAHRDETINTTALAIDKIKNILYTNENLTNLGTVTGKATLSIEGTTTVAGSVYGGGEESGVDGTTEVAITGGTIGAQGQGGVEYGNVYGGGKGNREKVTAGLVKGSTKVTISQTTADKPTTVYHNVYGGGAYGSVGDFDYDATTGMPTGLKAGAAENSGKTEVYITGGTLGWNGKENGMVFGSSRGDVGSPGSIEDKLAWVYDTHVAIGDTAANATITTATPLIKGSIYGGGENGHNLRNSYVRINGGTIGVLTGDNVVVTNADNSQTTYEPYNYPYRGNIYGGGCGTDMYYSDPTSVTNPYDGKGDNYNPLAGVVKGNAFVNITGGYVVHNVYGAGAMGSVGTDASGGKTTVIISGGRIGYDGNDNGNVFSAARGGQGIAPNLANVKQTEVNISYTTTPAGDNEDKTEQLIAGSVFGGGEAGTVKGDVAVKMGGGLILKDLYGGGALAHTNTNNWKYDTTNQQWGNTWAEGKTSASNTTTVTLTGGAVGGNVYGGGLGRMEVKAQPEVAADPEHGIEAQAAVEGVAGIPAKVYGDVTVTLNGTATAGEGGTTLYNDNCVVKGSIFGCNNLNGSPQGDVTVHIYKTQRWEGHAGTATADLSSKDASKHSYHVAAVYGGGNMAAYEPEGGKNTTRATNVIIDGCGLTSIRQVYGGGNAASTPATCVTVNGTHEIEEVFGGGNGKDKITVSGVEKDNPGANVGFYDYSAVEDTYNTKELRLGDDFTKDYIYGTGKASVNIYGGTIHRVFGGSNTKGNVRQTAVTMLEEASGCDFCVDEAYGGGKSAPMDAEAKLLMACIPGLQAAYGGAEAANIEGNVTLNITNGNFDRVFGGNNISGTIGGTITVNVEETGCKPIIIGQLYGGGNQAPYTAPDGVTGPTINARSFTSIGDVFGGGYGKTAVVTGNTTVNINVCQGKFSTPDESMASYISGAIGTGKRSITFTEYKRTDDGDFEHDDDGNRIAEEKTVEVTLPTHEDGKIGAVNRVFGGGNAAKVVGNTNVNIGTTTGDKVTLVSTSEEATVLGADVRGNIYGGGNQAEVTGNTNVQIGKKME